MPAPIGRPSLDFIPRLGTPKRELPRLAANATAAELLAQLDASWGAIRRGNVPQLSASEAAWLVEVAKHPAADAAVWKAIVAGCADTPMTPALKNLGFERFLEQLSRPVAPPVVDPAPGPAPAPVQPGRPGERPIDVRVGGDFNRPAPESKYSVDLAKAGEVFGHPFERVSDLFTSKLTLPNGGTISAPTHMIGQTEDSIRVIAYNDADGPKQKDVARFIAPGEIAIAIKHHCPHPDLGEKEAMKLQCTHIEIAVGVNTEDGPGAITINNPQNYQRGLFGTPDYPMIFVKPKFPDGLTNEQKQQYVDNTRTWLVIANTFTNFPGNYNGGDPLGTRSVTQVKQLGDKLLLALSGDADAKAWLRAPENQVYCAELAHVALNLGLHYPLNEASLGAERYAAVKAALADKAFVRDNANPFAGLVKLQMAPAGMKPVTEQLGLEATEPGATRAFGKGLAIEPFTMAEIVEEFLQSTVPREKMGEALAPVQAEILKRAQHGLFEAMGIEAMPAEDPRRAAVEALYTRLVDTVARPYGTYAEFRGALMPLLLEARKVTNPRGDGTGAFVPPSCYLVRATESVEGQPSAAIFGWQYLGHGLHTDMLQPKA